MILAFSLSAMRPSALLLAGSLFLSPGAHAAVFEQVAEELSFGAGAGPVAVLGADRVAVSAVGAQGNVLAWMDTVDLSLAAQTYGVGSTIATLLAVEDESGSRLYGAGDQLDTFTFDTADEPATIALSTPRGLGAQGGFLVALAWDLGRAALYGADQERSLVRHFAEDGSGSGVDAAPGWPLSLPFPPSDLVMLDDDTLVVVGNDSGEPGVAIVALDGDVGPEVKPLPVPMDGAGLPVAVASDHDGTAWVLLEGGDLWLVGEPETTGDDDTAGDDDSATGDDDSATGDDDSSLGDDDSALSMARGATETDLEVRPLVDLALPTPATDLLWIERTDGQYLLAAGANLVRTISIDGADLGTLALTGSVAGLAVSSEADGHAWVGEPATGLVGLLSTGPHVTIDGVTGNPVPSDVQDLVLEFTASMGGGTASSCAWSVLVDGDITGSGEVIEGAAGEALDGEAVTVTISGALLPAGQHRLHVRCVDAQGDVGRASTLVYKGTLVAPTNFSATPSDTRVVVRFDPLDDTSVDHYLIWWGLSDFGPAVEPQATNEDGTMTSPITVDAPALSGDDDSAADEGAETIALTVYGLTNELTYYFAVAAVDGDGQEGPRTAVLSAKPGLTGGAAVIAGETGGCTCDGAGAPSSLLALLLLPLARRRGQR